MLKKDALFQWTEEDNVAIQDIKNQISKDVHLMYFNTTKDIALHGVDLGESAVDSWSLLVANSEAWHGSLVLLAYFCCQDIWTNVII